MGDFIRLTSIFIDGYRPFRDFNALLGPLEVIVGANGSGKSSLFEFLRFIRDGVNSEEIPTGIIKGSIGRQVFHGSRDQKFLWGLVIASDDLIVSYTGNLLGPIGNPSISSEHVDVSISQWLSSIHKGLEEPPSLRRDDAYWASVGIETSVDKREVIQVKENQFALGTIHSPSLQGLFRLAKYIRNWRFYDAYNIEMVKLRSPVYIKQEPSLHEDAGNLSSVLHFFMTEHPRIFDELQQHLRSVVPGFKSLNVKARGEGQVLAYWSEGGVDSELSLADLSDGIIRLICWFVLCLHPKPPTLICIDEPELGVHPRTMPVLAGLIEKATERTQLIVATHSSYFLTQFDIKHIAIMRKENGAAVFVKPKDSKIIQGMLEDFGPEEIEALHLSDELEYYS